MAINSLAAASRGSFPAVFSQRPGSISACVRACGPRAPCKESARCRKAQSCWFRGTAKQRQVGTWALAVDLELRFRLHLMPGKKTRAIKKKKKERNVTCVK